MIPPRESRLKKNTHAKAELEQEAREKTGRERSEAGRSIHQMRKVIVVPVFGQFMERRGFRRFSLLRT